MKWRAWDGAASNLQPLAQDRVGPLARDLDVPGGEERRERALHRLLGVHGLGRAARVRFDLAAAPGADVRVGGGEQGARDAAPAVLGVHEAAADRVAAVVGPEL